MGKDCGKVVRGIGDECNHVEKMVYAAGVGVAGDDNGQTRKNVGARRLYVSKVLRGDRSSSET